MNISIIDYIEFMLKQFTHFFNEHYTRYIHFAMNYVQDKEEAEDIVMEAMLDFLKHRTQGMLPDNTNMPSYVLTSVKHKCLNHLKAFRTTYQESLDDMEQWEIENHIKALENIEPHEIYTTEIQRLVADTLSSLPPQTRRIFNMSRLENLSNNEIALRLDFSVKKVEYHITKTLKALRLTLKDYLPMVIIMIFFQ